MDEYKKLLSSKTKLVSIVHVSNALGTVNPVREIIECAHQVGAVGSCGWRAVSCALGYRCDRNGL